MTDQIQDAIATEERRLAGIYLTCLLTGSVVLEAMDALADSSAYRQRLKLTAKSFAQEMEKTILAEGEQVWKNDNGETQYHVEAIRQVCARVSKMPPEIFSVLLAFLDRYEQAPERTLQRLQVKMQESTDHKEAA